MTKEQFEHINEEIIALRGEFAKEYDEKLNEECIQALAKLYESSQWQPIETAPRDEEVMFADLDPDLGTWIGCISTKMYEDVVVVDQDGMRCNTPTHWKPLSEGPK